MAITLSIGIGLDGLSYAQNYEFARNAVDLALGRGGDQAVIKNSENVTYYGGKSRQVEKSTRVKARVKAQALKEIIDSRDKIFIMGHREYDPRTLEREYLRDKDAGLAIEVPKNYYPDDDDTKEPVVTWRSHANLLYANWLNYMVYQTTPYDLNEISG